MWRLSLQVGSMLMYILCSITFSIAAHLQRQNSRLCLRTIVEVSYHHIHTHLSFLLLSATSLLRVDHVLLFFKYYDPARRLLIYMGHSILPVNVKFSALPSEPYFCFMILFQLQLTFSLFCGRELASLQTHP